ncbi:hypothetical protein Tco_0316200 [Tanacetum coccineum]
MMDVSIHQEDLDVQRTPLIDLVISMVTEKTASTPHHNPHTLQAQMFSTSYSEIIQKGCLEVLVGAGKQRRTKDCCRGQSVLTDPEDQAKMEMETPRSSGVNSPPNAHT